MVMAWPITAIINILYLICIYILSFIVCEPLKIIFEKHWQHFLLWFLVLRDEQNP